MQRDETPSSFIAGLFPGKFLVERNSSCCCTQNKICSRTEHDKLILEVEQTWGSRIRAVPMAHSASGARLHFCYLARDESQCKPGSDFSTGGDTAVGEANG